MAEPQPNVRGAAYAPIDRMWVGDYLPTDRFVKSKMAWLAVKLADELRSAPIDLYSPEVLLWHQDMRALR